MLTFLTYNPVIIDPMRWTESAVIFFAGSCTFDDGFSQCDYQQDPYDDFDWTHINTQEASYVSPNLPQGETFLLSSSLKHFYVSISILVVSLLTQELWKTSINMMFWLIRETYISKAAKKQHKHFHTFKSPKLHIIT